MRFGMAFGLMLTLNAVAFGAPVTLTSSATDLSQGSWGPAADPNPLGGTDVPTNVIYGQSFVVPVGTNALTDWAFNIGSVPTTAQFNFIYQVYAWNSGTNSTVGPALFTSGPVPNPPDSTSPTGFPQGPPPPGVPVTGLAEGGEYILLFNGQGPAVEESKVGFNQSNPINNSETGDLPDNTGFGWFQFVGTGGQVAAGNAWSPNVYSSNFQLGFVMNFDFIDPAPVPEASRVLLAALGGLAVIGFARRRLFAAA